MILFFFQKTLQQALKKEKKNKTTCGKLRDQCKIVIDRHSGRQVAHSILIPPFILVFLVIIAEGCLDGREVLPHIIVSSTA